MHTCCLSCPPPGLERRGEAPDATTEYRYAQADSVRKSTPYLQAKARKRQRMKMSMEELQRLEEEEEVLGIATLVSVAIPQASMQCRSMHLRTKPFLVVSMLAYSLPPFSPFLGGRGGEGRGGSGTSHKWPSWHKRYRWHQFKHPEW